jgi:hypothetical protein
MHTYKTQTIIEEMNNQLNVVKVFRMIYGN